MVDCGFGDRTEGPPCPSQATATPPIREELRHPVATRRLPTWRGFAKLDRLDYPRGKWRAPRPAPRKRRITQRNKETILFPSNWRGSNLRRQAGPTSRAPSGLKANRAGGEACCERHKWRRELPRASLAPRFPPQKLSCSGVRGNGFCGNIGCRRHIVGIFSFRSRSIAAQVNCATHIWKRPRKKQLHAQRKVGPPTFAGAPTLKLQHLQAPQCPKFMLLNASGRNLALQWLLIEEII